MRRITLLQTIKKIAGAIMMIFAFFAPFYCGPSIAIFVNGQYHHAGVPCVLIDYGVKDVISGLLTFAILVVWFAGLWMIIETMRR